jgi:alkane 1-monooxygenase
LNWTGWSGFLTSASNIAAMRIMTGTNSCCSGIAVAHELIHRRAPVKRCLGRILLWTVCYDHFMVEHLLGHHRRASTPDDPATARFGESYRTFWRRSLKQQFASAWRLESRRLRSLNVSPWRHRVMQGLLIQASLLIAIWTVFGAVALLMFLYQALVAVHLLETVNYFQHWGLTRGGRIFSGADAWSTDSWVTTHTFVGLSRHADHHAHASKPFPSLRFHEDSPRLPHGYFVMAVTVKLFNAQYRRLAEQELRGRTLGPHRAVSGTCLISPSSSNFAA